ncbi:transmembrane adaptor Erv26-domain-containing protein [Multifurca ochricompacta]|uniref:Transmembrane adaptor Erv26-domain-containing protein n=1 Tax=Multifurca ochricompacta TaxID=376703 RepID=A0AAD4QSD8_9AGAM|nr:transmembrane adaptor Erv26-domain-containing protein [Multifurca ochricompacta]
MSLLHLISYVASIAAFTFVTLSLASGLLWLSELIEEHSKLAKIIGKRAIYVIISLHVLLAFTDALPFQNIAFSILCHLVYLQNFSHTWPVISLTSPSFIASCILVVADHFMWFFHFARRTHEARQAAHMSYRGGPVVKAPTFGDMATFFGLCVWLTPLFLFLSLSANDNTLPTSGSLDTAAVSSPSAPSFPSSGQQQQHSRSSLFRLMFGFVPGLRRSSSRGAEGLIAPPSPGIHPPLSPSHPHSFPPRTPTRAASYGEVREQVSASLTPDFSLSRPPPRRTSASISNSTFGNPITARRRGSDKGTT